MVLANGQQLEVVVTLVYAEPLIIPQRNGNCYHRWTPVRREDCTRKCALCEARYCLLA